MGFTAIGRFLVHRRRLVLSLTAILVIAAGIYGADVAGRLSAGGFNDPTAESVRAERYLSERMGAGLPNLVLLVRTADPDGAPPGGTPAVDRPEVAAAGEAITARLQAEPGVTQVASYWGLGRPEPLRSDTGHSALIVAHASGDENAIDETTARVIERFNGSDDVTVVRTGGIAAGYTEASTLIEQDLRTAELIALPITLLVLVLVFRSLVAALTPIVGGVIAIIGTFAVLKGLAGITEVSVFALNLTTAMGLGLAIDYSLFTLSRYREERARGLDPHPAVVRTVATAGRSVVLSGLTVAVSMSALLVFPMSFLRSFAYAGIPVVFLAVLAAVVVLPALLAVLGDRINALPLGRRYREAPLVTSFWYRTARFVMRRPVGIAVLTTSFLLVLAVPFFHLTPGLPDDRVLPADAESRLVGDELRQHFSTQETGSLAVVLPGAPTDDARLGDYAARLSALDHVGRVDARTGIYLDGQRAVPPGPLTERFAVDGGDWISVVPTSDPLSPESESLVRVVRETAAPVDEVLVTGPGAAMVDTKDTVIGRLPWALAIVGGATFVLLFLSFGSLLVPLKALILNTLSLTATFGLMVWIFQDGHLSEPLSFTPTGMIDLTTPILMFCVAFGMSMDYEVFLLSRIKEEHDKGESNEESVALGLTRSARIITAAAATFSVVLLAFATSSITFIKLFGLGLAAAVVLDATVIRALLVPAFMKLAGAANWWAPRWMQAVQRRIDLSEREPDDVEPEREPAREPVGAAT